MGHPGHVLVDQDLVLRQSGQPVHRGRFRRHQPLLVWVGQTVDQLLVQIVGQSASRPGDGSDIDADALGIPFGDGLKQQRPLF